MDSQPLTRAAQPAHPGAWINAKAEQERFWPVLAHASRSLLICDYDGTLAPFKADKMTATPYPGVAERLEKIKALQKAALALVSGRPVAELLKVFPLAASLEIYGSHGREHRSATGVYQMEQATAGATEVLDRAATELTRLGYADALERKSASLAVHWRNLSRIEQASLAEVAREVFARHGGVAGGDSERPEPSQHQPPELAVLPFESGMELRAVDHTKAHAVAALLAGETGRDAAVAYLGDDTTDEDAFRELGARGLTLLVREEPRLTLARYWIRPPAQLLGFLDDWLRAASRRG